MQYFLNFEVYNNNRRVKVRQISLDQILANEMQLIYNNVEGFEPVGGNLRKWKGPVGIIQGTKITVYATIYISPEFPRIPPQVEITPKVNHPNVDDNDFLSLQILAQWKPRYHIYQVINDIRRLFANVPARPLRTKHMSTARSVSRSVVQPMKPRTVSRHTVRKQSVPSFNERSQTSIEKSTIEAEIEAYQQQINELNKQIEEKRAALIKKAEPSHSLKELTISVTDDLKASSRASNDLLELLNEKFDDGDLSSVDYLKLYRKYSVESYKTNKKLAYLENVGGQVMPSDLDKRLDFEADLYAAIVTLDNLARGYENGEIEQVAYKKQLRSLIRTVFKTRMKLEQLGGFDLDSFIEQENLVNRFDKGMRLLQMAEGTGTKDVEMIPFESLKKMPAKTADFVSAAIELIDLTRLRSVARADLLLSDVEELIHVLHSFPSIPQDHWMLDDMKNWKDILSNYKPSEIINEDDCEKLEFQASRWLNEFRRILKDM